ncbi:MAG: YjbF family lipoprotein [Paracoccus sp. (in: a-proteobacteria)]
MSGMVKHSKILGTLALTMALGACGSASDENQSSVLGQLGQIAGPAVAKVSGGKSAQPKAAPLSPEQMAARALSANPAPLILVGLENTGTVQVMAMVGDNTGMRTYMTPNEQALIIRGGMLVGTRGLGHDLSTAETEGTAVLIRARRAGEGKRTMRYLDGEGIERPLPMTCSVAIGGGKNFSFAGSSWTATQVTESCKGGGAEIQNSYLVTASGQIPVSRQWIGPNLDYVSIQTVRP